MSCTTLEVCAGDPAQIDIIQNNTTLIGIIQRTGADGPPGPQGPAGPTGPQGPSGANNYWYTLTVTDITNGYITLAATPSVSANVAVNIVSGCLQKNGLDYTVSGATLTFSGLGMATVVSSGDNLLIQF